MRDHFVKQLSLLAQDNPKIFLITGDLGFGVLDGFAQNYPRQYLNVGVAEQNMTGVATGLALEGRSVFTYSIGNFPTLRCLEQIRNDACYHGAHVTIVSIGGGFSYGALGFSHFATEDLAILRALPDVTVVAPCDTWETMQATAALAAKPNGVGYLRLDKSSANIAPKFADTFKIGAARTVREGDDVTLIGCGGIVGVALAAAERLACRGIMCRVVSCHTVSPLDREMVRRAAQETAGIITVEEHTVTGGLGGAIAECCLESGWVPRAFHRIGIRQTIASVVGSQDYMRTLHGMDEAAIIAAVEKMVGDSGSRNSLSSIAGVS
jgi:transketolase